ncbi:MAG: glutamate--tRNA ligase [Candidatus Nomurabacteria bacterium]|nr:glutamate--tRNA ligase [Candidatus Nomurabacteria bacterium]
MFNIFKKKENKPVVTRFAPSPTGFMHIGGVRTALYAYLWARKNNGEFILRIEDTDKDREVAGSIEHIQKSLAWLGIDWNYGPDKPGDFGSCIQSERLDSYHKYAQKLVDDGLAYPDPYTKEQVQEFRDKAEVEKRAFLFRDHRPQNFDTWDGKSSLRFKVPEIKRYHWNDAVRGDLEAGPEALDDFIIMKSDGYPTYNFAHIIDDYEMGVTHVMRGDEFISSMPRFLSLYDALDIPYPVFVTLPPIMGTDGKKKLGKRDGAKDVLEYKTEGYLAQAMVNFLAMIGWNPGTDQEIFSMDDLIDQFTIERIHHSGGAFNEEKLDWLNKQWMEKLDPAELRNGIESFVEPLRRLPQYSDDRFEQVLPVIAERISVFNDVADMIREGELQFFFEQPTYDREKIIWKKSTLDEARKHLTQTKKLFTDYNGAWDADGIKSAVWDYAGEQGRGDVLWPLRYALSGRDKSPDPFVIAAIIGKDETIARIETALD